MEADNGAFMEKFILEATSSSSHELPLKGLTFAVKDIFDLDGYVTGFGNPDWARTHSAATSTAPAVLALLREGATCIGKTVMDEMAYRLESNTLFLYMALSLLEGVFGWYDNIFKFMFYIKYKIELCWKLGSISSYVRLNFVVNFATNLNSHASIVIFVLNNYTK
ncbi:hypothetical protein CsSME_00023371 [Camellia sinensis var. sinensis]